MDIRHGKNLEYPGYMTIEASFIIPLTFICFILVILYSFYLYDHMVVYQSCYQSALRGSQIKNATDGAVRDYVDTEAEKLLDEQVYQYGTGHSVDVSPVSIKVSADSSMSNLTARFDLYPEEKLISDSYAAISRIDPVDYIRNADRLKNE